MQMTFSQHFSVVHSRLSTTLAQRMLEQVEFALSISILSSAVFVDLISKQREVNINLPRIYIANTGGAICTPKLVKDIQTHLNVTKVMHELCYMLGNDYESLLYSGSLDIRSHR